MTSIRVVPAERKGCIFIVLWSPYVQVTVLKWNSVAKIDNAKPQWPAKWQSMGLTIALPWVHAIMGFILRKGVEVLETSGKIRYQFQTF